MLSWIFCSLLLLVLAHSLPDEALTTALSKAAGVYIDPASNKLGVDMSHTVLVTGCNYAYLHFLHNLKCFVDSLGLKVLVFALDKRAHEYISSNMGPNMYSVFVGGLEEVGEGVSVFATHQFHVLTTRKKESVLSVMELGYDAVFVDTDIAVLRDPMPYLLWKNVDYVHSLNHICPHSNKWDFYSTQEEGNTGFYFVRSNSKTIKLFRDVMKEAPKFPGVDDQTIFWKWIRSTADPVIVPLKSCADYNKSTTPVSAVYSRPDEITAKIAVTQGPGREDLITCHLDGCVFSAGALRGVAFTWLQENLKLKSERACTIHANYLKGAELKMRALEKHGFWLATQENPGDRLYSGKCKFFKPLF